VKILVINAGSSSLKYQLFETATRKVLAKGLCERIGVEGGNGSPNVKHTPDDRDAYKTYVELKTHADAIKLVIKLLTEGDTAVIKSLSEIDAVGHRVLHGGSEFTGSMIVNDEVKAAIKKCFPLGPLHNPANLTGILACEEVMDNIPQVAVFDTAFHQTMPEKAYLYAIPYEYYEKYSIRRYGFHGTSHRYVSSEAAKILGKPAEELKIITCHLGNGSSVAAIKNGKCFDTSMGLTPLEGLPMGTRSGSIDPAILETIMNNEDISITEMLNILNKKSGVLGISGISSDFRDLYAAIDAGNARAAAAISCFIYSLQKYIGAYAAAMGGVDAVVFTAGIGENNSTLRADTVAPLAFMGIKIDPEKNKTGLLDISAADANLLSLRTQRNSSALLSKQLIGTNGVLSSKRDAVYIYPILQPTGHFARLL